MSVLVGAQKQQAWRRASSTTGEQPGQGAVGEAGEGERGGGRRRRTLLDQLCGCPRDVPPPLPSQGSGQGTAKAWLRPTEDVFPGGTPGRAEERREKQKRLCF